MKRLRVLNAFAGLGGNSMHWDNCEVVAIEENEKIAAVYQKLHPTHEVIVGDAYQFFKENHESFDFAWFSPPCQKHSRMMKATRHKVADYPDFRLYELITFLQHFFKGDWVVENVVPYYEPLIKPFSFMDWLGMQFDEVIYYKGNHCPVQVLRNCVHPVLGQSIFNSYREEQSQ